MLLCHAGGWIVAHPLLLQGGRDVGLGLGVRDMGPDDGLVRDLGHGPGQRVVQLAVVGKGG
eukprot:5490260-Alexandrium_andersonii.AAC.1